MLGERENFQKIFLHGKVMCLEIGDRVIIET